MRAILTRLQKVDRIVCVSQNTRKDLLSLIEIDPERIVTIPNAVFQTMRVATAEQRAAFRAELAIPKGAPLVLHIGRNFYKNHAVVLDTFAAVNRHRRDARMLFVSAPTPELKIRIARHGLVDRVRFLPRVSAQKMHVLYATASMLLFPSLYEGFGYPVLEAQLCGTPVICSNKGALPEVAGDGALIFDPNDVPGMVEAAKSLLEDTEMAQKLIARGHRNAERFSLDSWFESHKILYRNLGISPTSPLPCVRPVNTHADF